MESEFFKWEGELRFTNLFARSSNILLRNEACTLRPETHRPEKEGERPRERITGGDRNQGLSDAIQTVRLPEGVVGAVRKARPCGKGHRVADPRQWS